jgi:hypothetical protein
MRKHVQFIFITLLSLMYSCTDNKKSQLENATDDPNNLAGKNTYMNPVDGKIYSFSSTAVTSTSTKINSDRFVNTNITPTSLVLLTSKSKIEGIIGFDKLASFVSSTDSVFIEELSSSKEIGKIIVQYTLYAHKKPEISLSYDGDFSNKTLQNVSDKLESFCTKQRTIKDTCVFQNVFEINKPRK